MSNYYLEKREKRQNKWMSVSSRKLVETSCEVTGLIEGFEYEFRVKCENLGGESDWSEISESVIPKSDQAPRAPAFREEIRDMIVKYHANATFVTKVGALFKDTERGKNKAHLCVFGSFSQGGGASKTHGEVVPQWKGDLGRRLKDQSPGVQRRLLPAGHHQC